ELDMDIGEVRLSPRLPEAAGRIAQHRIAVGDQRIRDIALAVLAAAPAVKRCDQRVRSCARRHGEADLEQRAIDCAREKTRALAAALRGRFAAEARLRRPLAGAFAGDAAGAVLAIAISVVAEAGGGRRAGLREGRRLPGGE